MERQTIRRLALSAALGLAQGPLNAAGHGLLHPATELRELSTDRPDKTESAITMDAGHYALEMDVVTGQRTQDAASRGSSLGLGGFNLKAGLTDSVDLQWVFEPWDSRTAEDFAAGTSETLAGNGDLMFRLKVNLWGDDGGATKMALMPYVKFPTAAPGLGNGAVEGGLIAPLGLELGAGFGLGTMVELGVAQDAQGGGAHFDTVLSASLDHGLPLGLGGYLEFWQLLSGQSGAPQQASVDAGLTLPWGPNVQFDAGVNVGVSGPGEDLNPFLGLSVRI